MPSGLSLMGLLVGPDQLRPQHLKDMINIVNGGNLPLLTALAAFCSLVLEGKTPSSVHPFFFGANLVALKKKGGGVRPIAVGCTLRRLVAKVAGNKVVRDMSTLLAPHQLGYGISRGAEAALHTTRQYLNNLQPNHALLKLDFNNTFNSIWREEAVLSLVPVLYPFVNSVYSGSSSLFWND